MNDVLIKPTTDLFIAALWSAPKNEPILRSLLNGVMTDIGLPAVTKTTVLNPFNIQESAVDKQIRLDVRVEDESGTMYDVEVQTDSHAGFFDRMLYYWAETYASQLQRGEGYNRLVPVRSIVITEFPVFSSLRGLHAVFEVRSRENPAVLLSEHLQMHFLRLGNLLLDDPLGLEQLCLDLRRWMQFWAFGSEWEEEKMSTMLQDVPLVQAAYGEYKRFSADPVMRERAKERERFLIDKRLNRADAEAEGIVKVARNLKRLGASLTMIAEATGLTLLEIERLG
jgi:predicted transposase/invertase (TIGR01784 family)